MKNLTYLQKNQIDNIVSGNTYYRNTGKKWSKQNLLDEVAELFADEYIEADKWEEFLIKKQYTKEQLATMYITKKPFEKVVIRKTSLTQKELKFILNQMEFQLEQNPNYFLIQKEIIEKLRIETRFRNDEYKY
tara:strand:+ start:1051 stop:1449 length:399 start_codon:yes stop_codon:yes gene_type:complete